MSDIQWPEPVKKKTVWLELPLFIWDDLERIQKERSLSQEQVLNTLVLAGHRYFKHPARAVLKPAEPEKIDPKLAERARLNHEAKQRSISTDNPLGNKRRGKLTDAERKASQARYAHTWYVKNKEKKAAAAAAKPAPAVPVIQPAPVSEATERPAPVKEEFLGKTDIKVVKETTTGIPVIPEAAPIKPFEQTEFAKKRAESMARNEEAVTSKVVICALASCTGKKKFIKGMGIMYHDLEFCQDKCLEIFINTFEKKSRSRLGELEDDQPAPDWDGTLPGEEMRSSA